MTSPPSVRLSVCVCTMDRPEELRRCLSSVRRSEVVPYEIVVSDDSRQPEATRRACADFDLVRYVEGPRRGQGANRQCGAVACRGDYVCFVDDDAVLTPTFLGLMQAAAGRGGPRTIYTGEFEQDGERITPSNLTFWGHFGAPVRGELQNVVLTANAFPRALFDVVSFDPRLRFGYEDADLCSQALARGYRIVHVPGAYNVHLPSQRNRHQSASFIEQSRYYTTLKRYLLIQRRPGRAVGYLCLAPLHQVAHHLRRGAWREVARVGRDYAGALRLLWEAIASPRA